MSGLATLGLKTSRDPFTKLSQHFIKSSDNPSVCATHKQRLATPLSTRKSLLLWQSTPHAIGGHRRQSGIIGLPITLDARDPLAIIITPESRRVRVPHVHCVRDQQCGRGVAPLFQAGRANLIFLTLSRTLTPSGSGWPHLATRRRWSFIWESLHAGNSTDSPYAAGTALAQVHRRRIGAPSAVATQSG